MITHDNIDKLNFKQHHLATATTAWLCLSACKMLVKYPIQTCVKHYKAQYYNFLFKQYDNSDALPSPSPALIIQDVEATKQNRKKKVIDKHYILSASSTVTPKSGTNS